MQQLQVKKFQNDWLHLWIVMKEDYAENGLLRGQPF